MQASSPPVVLTLSGHDPTGGAGLQADIEAIRDQGCHPATAVTCLTVQDTTGVHGLQPVKAELLRDQALRVLADLAPAALKIGLLADSATAATVAGLLEETPDLPLVLDPVLHSGADDPLGAAEWLQPLLPHCTLVTPNRREARALTGRADPADAARRLLHRGCRAVLVTGADEAERGEVVNSLYTREGVRHWRWHRLPGTYHGSGCTLAAALAARLALGEELQTAADRAQAYTHRTLQRAIAPGRGQRLPGRCRGRS